MSEFLPQDLVEESLLVCTEEEGTTVASVGCQSIREWQGVMIRQRLEAAMDRHGSRLAPCLAGVTSISSEFIRDLIQLTDRVTAKRGRLVIFGVDATIASLFRAAGFDAKLTLAESRAEAIELAQGGARGGGKRSAGLLGRFRGRKAA